MKAPYFNELYKTEAQKGIERISEKKPQIARRIQDEQRRAEEERIKRQEEERKNESLFRIFDFVAENGVAVVRGVKDKSQTSYFVPEYIRISGKKLPVMIIGTEAFKDCKNAKEINVFYATKIRDRAFYGCSNLRDISFSDQVVEVGNEIVEGTRLSDVNLLPKRFYDKLAGTPLHQNNQMQQARFNKLKGSRWTMNDNNYSFVLTINNDDSFSCNVSYRGSQRLRSGLIEQYDGKMTVSGVWEYKGGQIYLYNTGNSISKQYDTYHGGAATHEILMMGIGNYLKGNGGYYLSEDGRTMGTKVTWRRTN